MVGMLSGAVTIAILQKLKHKLPYDRAVPLLGIYPKELKMGVEIMFTAALFAIASGKSYPVVHR